MAEQDSVFTDVLGDLPRETLDLLGGKLYKVGYQDGFLADMARSRQIWYRVRYPKDFSGPAAILLISHGGIGNEAGPTLLGQVHEPG